MQITPMTTMMTYAVEPLHEERYPVAELLDLFGLQNARGLALGQAAALAGHRLQHEHRLLHGQRVVQQRAVPQIRQVQHGPLEVLIEHREGGLTRFGPEGFDRLLELPRAGHDRLHLPVLLGGLSRGSGRTLEAAEQDSHRHRQADRSRDGHEEDDGDVVVDPHGLGRQAPATNR
jgi:hypothetical protein